MLSTEYAQPRSRSLIAFNTLVSICVSTVLRIWTIYSSAYYARLGTHIMLPSHSFSAWQCASRATM